MACVKMISYSSPSKTKMTIPTLARALHRPLKKHTTKVLAVCMTAVIFSVAFAYAAQPVLLPKHQLIISSHRVMHLQKTNVPLSTRPANSNSVVTSIPADSRSSITQSTPATTTITRTATTTISPNTSTAAVAASSASPGTTVSSLSKTPSVASSSSSQSSSSSSGQSSSSSSGSGSNSSASSDSYSSDNWSGYIDSGQSYSGITGNWIVPTPGGNGTSTSADATWIGIGGVTTDDLIQIGTENTVTSSGKVSSAVFYEFIQVH
jgi:hypothetical protein